MPLQPTFRCLFVFFIIFTSIVNANKWKTVIHLDQKYIQSSQIPDFYSEYKFQKKATKGGRVRYESQSRKVKIDFIIGSQEVFLNDVKFHFSYPVVYKNGKVLVSQIDLVKLLHPLLRPSTVPYDRMLTTIIIDPGHGGKDTGTVNNYGQEKNYTLDLARKLKTLLENLNFTVILTRTDDYHTTLLTRVEIANSYENAIFISLHFNAGGAGRASGIETFSLSPLGVAHYGKDLKKSDFQEKAGNQQDTLNIALAAAVHGRTTRSLEAKDRGTRRARYTVLSGVKHPAILFEGGFMSHRLDAIKINNDSYLDAMARALFNGIVVYKNAMEGRTANR